MTTNPHVDEIREMNLAYLLLAQRLLNGDRVEAMFRLKVDEEMADLLASLNAQQLARLANTNQLLCHFGGESAEQLRQVADNPRDQGLAHFHSSLLMASRSMLSQGGEHVG
ncbi:flagellar transcriptional regulator FlhD [Halomonas beimenensis]|uniref:Flagellar transcriptional regulator FlhD n=1 Tax=Halomonas beimenensis TaxID=475662 RepID=A0A291PCL7_9GAMM|nr:flagellar transcriptional regulator FlhD [Halomonas beimenensis]ATJ84637.1 flagellar transcriptional activator FlhD [Halomonas beimenensis]